jgi:hypothetical protein
MRRLRSALFLRSTANESRADRRRKLITVIADQGDQIGRILANWAIVFFGQFFVNYRSRPVLGLLFGAVKSMYVLIVTKMGRATFWAI